MAADASPPEIPLISLVKSTPADVLEALSTIGFLHLDLSGTGLSQDEVDRAFEISKTIHGVSLDQKESYGKDAWGNGYFPMKGSLDERSSSTDYKEAYVYGRFDSKAGQTKTVQIMPSSIDSLRSEVQEFYVKAFEASLRVLDMLSQALDVRTASVER